MEEHSLVTGPGLRELLALGTLFTLGFIIYRATRDSFVATLKERAATISKKIIDAQFELERMTLETARARRELAEISKTKDRLLAEVREEGLKLYESVIREATTTAERIISDAKLAIDAEAESAQLSLRKEAVRRAMAQVVAMASEPGAQDFRENLHKRLVAQFTERSPLEGLKNDGV